MTGVHYSIMLRPKNLTCRQKFISTRTRFVLLSKQSCKEHSFNDTCTDECRCFRVVNVLYFFHR